MSTVYLVRQRLCVCVLTPWTVAHQAPLSMGFLRQEYWSWLPFPPLGDLLDPGIKPVSGVSCIGRWILYHWATWEARRQGSVQSLSHVQLFATPWTAACQASLSISNSGMYLGLNSGHTFCSNSLPAAFLNFHIFDINRENFLLFLFFCKTCLYAIICLLFQINMIVLSTTKSCQGWHQTN